MVTPMFTVFQTMTGFHGGLRRGAAAGAVGVMLVLSAGIPAANAAGPRPQDSCFLVFCSPSPPKTAEPTPTQPPPDPADPSEAPAPPGTPSHPPAPAPAPAVPSDPGPTEETVAPSSGPSSNPSASPGSTADGDPGSSATGSPAVAHGPGPHTQQAQAAGGLGSAGQGAAPASGAKDNAATSSRNLATASLVNQDKGNAASVWWGIVLLAVAGIALVIFFRLRRTEKLHTASA